MNKANLIDQLTGLSIAARNALNDDEIRRHSALDFVASVLDAIVERLEHADIEDLTDAQAQAAVDSWLASTPREMPALHNMHDIWRARMRDAFRAAMEAKQ